MNPKQDALIFLCAAVGGLLGYAAFFWIARQGFYGLILPGGLLGMGAGIFRTRSRYVPFVCGLLALALGLYTEWRFAPFAVDNSLGFFLSHVFELRGMTQLMITAGALVAIWIPFRRGQEARRVSREADTSEASE